MAAETTGTLADQKWRRWPDDPRGPVIMSGDAVVLRLEKLGFTGAALSVASAGVGQSIKTGVSAYERIE